VQVTVYVELSKVSIPMRPAAAEAKRDCQRAAAEAMDKTELLRDKITTA
jgi:hypothetical protein